ncbi:MAG TPA: heavy metal-binding domain-containing protein [Azospirillaceae bacterium]|nr:heavy metal-binding domain-containing protein [Azospirillaceae bacterium]
MSGRHAGPWDFWASLPPDWMGGLAGPATVAILAALPFLVAGMVIERHHHRRLEEGAARLGHIGLLPTAGPLPPGAAASFVAASACIAPPPLGQLSARVRRLIGGRVDLLHRTQDRAVREVLLRLREQAAQAGASMVVGVKVRSVALGGRSRAVTVMATGMAVTGAATPSGFPPLGFLDDAASPPPRTVWHLLLLIAGALVALGLAAGLERAAERLFPGVRRLLRRLVRME